MAQKSLQSKFGSQATSVKDYLIGYPGNFSNKYACMIVLRCFCLFVLHRFRILLRCRDDTDAPKSEDRRQADVNIDHPLLPQGLEIAFHMDVHGIAVDHGVKDVFGGLAKQSDLGGVYNYTRRLGSESSPTEKEEALIRHLMPSVLRH